LVTAASRGLVTARGSAPTDRSAGTPSDDMATSGHR
jgi:hypothetical protein